MQVLIITPAYPAPDHGAYMGIQRNAEGVVTGLDEVGADVTVATTYWGRDNLPTETVTSEGITVVRLPDLSNRFGKFGRIADLDFYTFSRSIKNRTNLLRKADVVHSLMVAGAPTTDTPWIATHHHWGSSINSLTDLLYVPFHTAFKNYTYANMDAMTAPSAFAQDQLREKLWVQPPPIEVIPHGVDIDEFTPADVITDDPIRADSVRLLYAGPFEERKRLHDFVAALSELNKREVSFEAVFAGKGAGQSRLEKQVKQCGLESQVKFPGYVPDERLVEEYRRADLFVLPSVLEGFGQVLVEAMATHTPPVVCDLPPMNEIVPSDELVVEPRNPQSLADKIEHLVVEDRIEPLAKTCRSHIEENYNWTTIAARYLELYQSLQ